MELKEKKTLYSGYSFFILIGGILTTFFLIDALGPWIAFINIKNVVSNIIFVAGILLSAMLSGLTYSLLLLNAQKKDLEGVREISQGLHQERVLLAETTAKVEAILRSIADGVIATDKHGKILFINKAASEMLGVNPYEFTGKRKTEVIKIKNAADKLVVRQASLKQVLKKKNKTKRDSNVFYVRKDGSKFPVSFVVSPVVLEGKTIGAIEIFRDITKEKQIEDTKNEFVSLVSHQLRSPLTAIKWCAEDLLNGDLGPCNEEQKKYVELIYQSSQRTVDLIESLLNLSRLELGIFVVEKKAIDVRKLTNEVIQELMPQISEKKITFSLLLKNNLPSIQADPKLLRMIIQNLLSNAIKYTPKKGKVILELDVSANTLFMHVTDTGLGIPQEEQEKIFSKFFRAHNVRLSKTEGTGLGLYIVKKMVEKMRGKITFESREKKGTTFIVSLPIIVSSS